MARPKNTIPTYRLHKPSGTARCWLNGHWVTLGKHGSDESRQEYSRILAELAVAPLPGQVPGQIAPDISVNEVLLGFWRHAEQHYRDSDGKPTNELPQYRQTFCLVKRLYGRIPAKDFGPLALKALREEMIKTGWCRKLINQRVGRVRRVFKWAASEQLVPSSVYESLTTVTGLQQGRTKAKESPPVTPVAVEHVEATVPFLRPAVRAMVQVQLLTGMRPGEVCGLRPISIDTSESVWLFSPGTHKTRWRGKSRIIPIGPQAQAVLEQFTPADPSGFYFNPSKVVEHLHSERAGARKTKQYPSHMERNLTKRVPVATRKPGARYPVTSYERAIKRAVMRANRPFVEAGVELDQHIPHWHPNQLRHTLGTLVRERFGLEAAQVVLGHERADVTQVYAERNLDLAKKVAAQIG